VRKAPPPPPPVFNDAAFERHFKPVLDRYRAKREMLQRWRRRFNERAEALARFLKETMDEAYARRVYQQVLPGGPDAPAPESLPRPCHYDQGHLGRILGHQRGGDGAGRRVFDPWSGRWQGKWTSGPNRPANHPAGANPSDQHHVWDETRQSGDAAVQPVSQSESGTVDGSNIDAETAAGRADLGVNVYDETVGIGGWVSKRQRGQNVELPHIGFRVASGVLIWITQRHDADCKSLDGDDDFFVYFEWADENGRYGILGKRLKIDGTDVRELTAGEGAYPGEQHGGVYRRP
jgi:hypothetical protein